MKKYENRILSYYYTINGSYILNYLNNSGKEGWNLCFVVIDSEFKTKNFYLKRKIRKNQNNS